MTRPEEMKAGAAVTSWLASPLTRETRLAIDRLARTEDVRRIAVMPDAHWAEEVCVGTVVATSRRILPGAVGTDLGCGVAALRLEARASLLEDERAAARLLAGLYRTVPAVRHGRETAVVALPDGLADASLSDPRLDKVARRDGRVEFATLGRGNHFLEVQADEEDRLWLMCHSGSRAMGEAIARHHVERARTASTGIRWLEADADEGRAYLHDLAWALRYADASRRAVLRACGALVADLFGIAVDEASLVACAHNFVRRETHGGEDLWVHRKGAIPAAAGEPGIVPGSMGTPSFHVEGRGLDAALFSSAHGAGRALSRSEARRRIGLADLRRQMRGVWFDHRRADDLRDEAPGAYKDVGAVMRAQHDLVRVVRRLRPILSFKG